MESETDTQRQRQTLERAVSILKDIKSVESWELQSLSRPEPWQRSLHVVKGRLRTLTKGPGGSPGAGMAS